MWKKKREIEQDNISASNVCYAGGRGEDISAYLCGEGLPANFLISGGVEAYRRYQPLGPVLDAVVGTCPLIILHRGEGYMLDLLTRLGRDGREEKDPPLWVIDGRSPSFEPFCGMSVMQAVATLRQLAKKLGYTAAPRFERCARAHFRILEELSIPLSLSGLYYLCCFDDMEEFHDNIMALPCGENTARRIWADLGVDSEEGGSQFDLFRAVIHSLAHAASRCGWSDDNSVSVHNCLQALRQGAVMVLEINSAYGDLFMTYLAEELRGNTAPFVLLLDGVPMTDGTFFEYLCLPNTGCSYGILSENAVELMGGDEAAFLRLAERIANFVIFKHSTGKTATILAEVFGRYDHTRVELSQGTNQGYFQFLPRDRHSDIRYSVENRYRVMPEEITSLRADQAVIFLTADDAVIHYN